MNPSRRSFRPVLLLIAFAANCLAASPASAQTDATSERVIELPPLLVEEPAKPLRWRYVEFPGIEVLSVVSDGDTKTFLKRYHNQSQILQWILPSRLQGRSSVPDEYILFNDNLTRAHSQEVMKTMMSSQREAARRKLSQEGKEAGEPDFGRNRSRAPRIKFLPNMRLIDVDTTAVFVVVKDSDNLASDFTFSLDRIVHLLASRVPVLPSWFSVGMVGLYQRADFGDDRVTFRPATWTTPAAVTALQDNPEPLRTLLPMSELFSGRPRPGSPEAGFDKLWRAQCALFLRWAIADDNGSRREALWGFIDRLEREPPSEALFEKYFNVGYSDMRDILSDYLVSSVDQKVTLRGGRVAKPPAIELRDASPLDIARIRGDWERIQINFVRRAFPDVVDKYIEQARRTLRKPYDQGERDPRLLALLGLLECDAGDRAAGLPFLAAAFRGRVERPRVYYELALSRYLAAAGSMNGAGLSAGQIGEISAPIEASWDMQPPIPASYAILADAWFRTRETPPDAVCDHLNRAATLFPQVEGLVLRVARLNVKRGDLERAESQLRQSLSNASDPNLQKAIASELERVTGERAKTASATYPH
ncbi:MAG: hypothetical protein HS122_12015 [Opitutaceae bacterium]|nr:hypothetical protein [Opitutaceae bacterium]